MHRRVLSVNKIYTVPALQAKLSPIFREYRVKKVTLFGFYANGIANSLRDVDLLVDNDLRNLAFLRLLELVSETIERPVGLINMTQITIER